MTIAPFIDDQTREAIAEYARTLSSVLEQALERGEGVRVEWSDDGQWAMQPSDLVPAGVIEERRVNDPDCVGDTLMDA